MTTQTTTVTIPITPTQEAITIVASDAVALGPTGPRGPRGLTGLTGAVGVSPPAPLLITRLGRASVPSTTSPEVQVTVTLSVGDAAFLHTDYVAVASVYGSDSFSVRGILLRTTTSVTLVLENTGAPSASPASGVFVDVIATTTAASNVAGAGPLFVVP